MIACDYYYSARMDSKKKRWQQILSAEGLCRLRQFVGAIHLIEDFAHLSQLRLQPLDHPFVAITMLFYMFYLIRSMYFYIFGW
jgi:hypothetical protein